MVTFIRKNGLNLAILTQIGRLGDNLVKPSRLQKNISEIFIFFSVKRNSPIAKITNLYIEMALSTRVGENKAPRTCVWSVLEAY